MSGRVVHFEIPFDDGDRARSFYKEAFDWNVEEMPELSYTMVASGPTSDQGMPSEPGFINGGMFQRDDQTANTPVIVVDVASIDAALTKIEEVGGSTMVAKQAVSDMGFVAYFKDTEGNLMGLWERAAQG